MPDDNPEDKQRPRPRAISAKLRRFLGPARTAHDQPESGRAPHEAAPKLVKEEASKVTPEAGKQERSSSSLPREEPSESDYGLRGSRGGVAPAPATKLSRAIKMKKVGLIFGGISLLLAVFYVGKKFEYLKYQITSRNKPRLSDILPDKFQGLTADELVEQGLAAQRLGNWQEAAERFFAAKRKSLTYRGLLFRVGKLHYDHGEFDIADKLFERAVAFGENVDSASFLRGVIAVNRGNFPAAERFFEAATSAEPFIPAYLYYWGESLRRSHQPIEAIPVYERASRRFDTEQERTVCNFKVRMAMVEAGQTTPLSVDVDSKEQTGPLPVDWLMTAAALRIREGNLAEAVPLIDKAYKDDHANLDSLFASCAGDMFFIYASAKNPEIARACQVSRAPSPLGFR